MELLTALKKKKKKILWLLFYELTVVFLLKESNSDMSAHMTKGPVFPIGYIY